MSYVTGGISGAAGGGGFAAGGKDALLGAVDPKTGKRTGGSLMNTASSGGSMFGGASNAGFTPRAGTSTGAPSQTGDNWMSGVLKAGLGYLNTIGDDAVKDEG
jgi:hypothetical protein